MCASDRRWSGSKLQHAAAHAVDSRLGAEGMEGHEGAAAAERAGEDGPVDRASATWRPSSLTDLATWWWTPWTGGDVTCAWLQAPRPVKVAWLIVNVLQAPCHLNGSGYRRCQRQRGATGWQHHVMMRGRIRQRCLEQAQPAAHPTRRDRSHSVGACCRPCTLGTQSAAALPLCPCSPAETAAPSLPRRKPPSPWPSHSSPSITFNEYQRLPSAPSSPRAGANSASWRRAQALHSAPLRGHGAADDCCMPCASKVRSASLLALLASSSCCSCSIALSAAASLPRKCVFCASRSATCCPP